MSLETELKMIYDQEMTEAQDEMPDEVSHGFLCQLAAERTIEIVNERVQRLADNRKWGHIEEVNKAFFDKPYVGGADPFTGG